jgi:iron complex transport system substrate-binding protein
MPLASRAGKAVREGAPSQKTSAAGEPEPLAEGGFVLQRLMFLVAVAAVVCVASVEPAGAAVPQRVVSLSPTATESLFAIGAGKQVVAVDELSDYPKRAPRTSLSGYSPNVEAIAGYRPDLVVVFGNVNDVVPGLRRLGIGVLVQEPAKNLAGTYAQIRQLGAATGHRKAAAALVKRMKRSVARAIAAVPRRNRSVYHELTPDFYSATSNTFIGRIYKLFGLRNIADAAENAGSGFPQLSAEYIISANPSLIVLADSKCCGQNAATVATRPGWSTISAVRTRSVIAIDDSVASRWGPRVVQFVRAVGRALTRLR